MSCPDIDKANFLDRNMTMLASKLFRDDPLVKEMSEGLDGVRREALDIIIEHINST